MEPDGKQDEALATGDEMTPLDPGHVWVLRVRTGLAAVAAVAAGYGLDMALFEILGRQRFVLTAAALLLGILLAFFYPPRRYRAWGYREGADEIEIRRGSLIRRRTIVPFGRVQHIDIAQGPIQRPRGLATLVLHTAGTQDASVSLPGLAQHDAEAMRDRIRAKIRQEFV